MDNLNYDFGKILQDSKRREEIINNAYENSVQKEPVNYKENTKIKGVKNAKRILAIGAAVLIVFGAGYSINNKVETKQQNSIVSEYINTNYEGIISSYRTDGNKYVAYNNEKIAENIMQCENFDEAVYAAWYSMEYNKSENMNEVFWNLPFEGNFYGYLREKGFVNEKGEIDTEAYSAAMKADIIENQSAKGSK